MSSPTPVQEALDLVERFGHPAALEVARTARNTSTNHMTQPHWEAVYDEVERLQNAAEGSA